MSCNRYEEKLESDEGLGMVNHDKDSFASRVVGAEEGPSDMGEYAEN